MKMEMYRQQSADVLHIPEINICMSNLTAWNYAADMNVVMTYYKCVDDWNDEKKNIKSFLWSFVKEKGKKIISLL